jgi:WD40 repeat protein/serine/threonine protein kinase
MSNTANSVSLRHCPNCGLEVPDSGWEGLCPKCLVLVSLRGVFPSPGQSEKGPDFPDSMPASHQPAAMLARTNEQEVQSQDLSAGIDRSFGDYQLLEEIGRGGMGVVFKARQLSLNRTVAVKILLAGPMAGGQRMERFRAEAKAVAQLQHPNVVAIYGVGEHNGAPFFSMEYIPGRTLADLVAQKPLPPEVAARYVRTVSEAIKYAHERGIVHRDLKPSNVLIDDSGRPRITDFGLAKRLPSSSDSQVLALNSEVTLTGQVLGSPSYLAPEQAGDNRAKVGPASDVYALGAILFHLLTGRPPFLSETLEGTLLQVLTTDPVGARQFNPALPRDLETICSKCLQKEPGQRYQSAQALAEDLGRFLERRPIVARPTGPIARLWRWCERHPATAAAVALLQISFAAGLAGILLEWHRAHQDELSLQRNLYAADVHVAQEAIDDNNLGRATALLQQHVPKSPTEPDLRGFEWHYLWGLCQGNELATFPGDGSIVSCVRFSPDGRLIASAGFDGLVTLRETGTQRLLARLEGLNGPACRLGLSFSPDGKLLAAAAGTNLFLWNTDNWTPVRRLEAHSAPLGGAGYQVAFSPDARRLAARLNGDIHIFEIATGLPRITIPGVVSETASLLAFSPDGKTLATYDDHHVRFLNAETGRERMVSSGNYSQVFGMAFAPGSPLLAIVSASGTLRLIDSNNGASARSVNAHSGSAQAVAFSPDGQTIATCGADQLVRLWDFGTLTNKATLKGHRSEVWSVAFSPDGQTLASGSKDGTMKLWSVKIATGNLSALGDSSTPLWFAPDGKILLTRSWKGSLHYWDPQSARERRIIGPLQTGAERYFTTVSSDGKYLATSVEDGRVFLWDLEANKCLWTNRVDANPANAMAFSPDNRQLALSTGQYIGARWQGGTMLLNLATGKIEVLSSDYAGTRDAACVAFSSDGKLLAGAGADYTICIWDLTERTRRAVLKGHTWNVMSLAFSPDGKLLASGGNDNTARLWEVATGAEVARLTGHKTGIVQVGFSPDGRTLATSGNDKTVRLWSIDTHGELLALKVATTWTHFLFSPDNHILATGGTSGPLELWKATAN